MTVESVMDGMPLQEAGIQQGDVITSINGVKITNAADYQKYIQENPLTEKSVKITYSRDGQEYDITVTPKEYRTAESGFTYNMYSEKQKAEYSQIWCRRSKIYGTYNDSQPERAGQRKAWNERSEWSGRNCGCNRNYV